MRPFKAGDLVKIVSKSTGRTLPSVEKVGRYNPDKPQKISRVDGNRIVVINGDYYLITDIRHWHNDIDDLFDKLIEEL